MSSLTQFVYIAHRLFALHDRVLAATVAQRIASLVPPGVVFLPYCDTQEDTLEIAEKGRFLFERDIERLKSTSVLVALLHGPGYDDGTCFEIGFAYGSKKRLVLFTTDFLTYSFGERNEPSLFSDPLLQSIGAKIVRVTEPASISDANQTDASEQDSDRYVVFRHRNELSLNNAITTVADEACALLSGDVSVASHRKTQRRRGNLLYVEPSPHGATDVFLAADLARREGWEVHISSRLSGQTDPFVSSQEDLEAARESSILLLDGNGPEVPAGAAFMAGFGLSVGRPTILFNSGQQVTHAHGREPNKRNLMLLYGCTHHVGSADEMQSALLREF